MYALKKLHILFLCMAVFALVSPLFSAYATEGGGGAYPNGAEGFMSGAVPPPGLHFVDYLTTYSADKFMDNNGDEIPMDFKVRASVNVFRLVYTTQKQFFGGYWGIQGLVPVMHMEVTSPAGKDEKTGIGDIDVGTFLSWHSKNFHAALGLDFMLPTGDYDKNDIANLGRNYITIEPAIGLTYISDSGFEVSGKFMYDYNTENKDTDYLSGQEFHVDYTLAFHKNNFALGLGGYYYKQITDDEVNGASVENNKGQVLAAGPQIMYQKDNLIMSLKYQQEMMVKNRPEGDKLWFKLIYSF
ncbi:SphA family protein [Geovibrio sp. ADMFC3]